MKRNKAEKRLISKEVKIDFPSEEKERGNVCGTSCKASTKEG